jgi:quinol monooxygenase YgiN
VAVADNGVTRVHWGRWDSEATLKHVQSQEYFATFAAKVKEFADGPPEAVVATPRDHTGNW